MPSKSALDFRSIFIDDPQLFPRTLSFSSAFSLSFLKKGEFYGVLISVMPEA